MFHNIISIRFMRISSLTRYLFSNYKAVNLSFNQQIKSAKIKLVNPKKRNVLSHETIKQLLSCLTEVQKSVQNKQTKIIVLQGQGTVFCSGHDLKQLADSKDPKEVFNSCTELMLKIKNSSVPTLCVVNGIAAAAGFQLALACDLLIASQKSSFSTPGIKWGLFCSTPAVELIRSISSTKKANEMLIFGQPISAKEAYQYGLLNKVVQEDDIEKQVNNYIMKTLNLSGEVIGLGKKVLRQQEKESLEKAYCLAGDGMQENIKAKEDCQEGFKAFREKRHPHFKN